MAARLPGLSQSAGNIPARSSDESDTYRERSAPLSRGSPRIAPTRHENLATPTTTISGRQNGEDEGKEEVPLG